MPIIASNASHPLGSKRGDKKKRPLGFQHNPSFAAAEAEKIPGLGELLANLSTKGVAEVEGLQGGALAWWLAQLVRVSGRTVWVLTSSYRRAQQLMQDLAFFSPGVPVHGFPHWDTMPFELFSPVTEAIAQRLSAADALRQGGVHIGVGLVQGWMQGTLPGKILGEHTFSLSVGQLVEREYLLRRLLEAGYMRVELVEAAGEFAVRGHLVDVFPPHNTHPLRLDFFDDEITTMRSFDTGSQLSNAELTSQRILPANEALLTDEGAKRARLHLRQHKAQLDPELYQQLWSQLEQASPFAGYEQLLPLYHGGAEWLHQQLPLQALLVLEEPHALWETARAFEAEVLREAQRAQEHGRLVIAPKSMFLSVKQLQQAIESYPRVHLHALKMADESRAGITVATRDNASLRVDAMGRAASRQEQQAMLQAGGQQLAKMLLGWRSQGTRILLAAASTVAAQRLKENLAAYDLASTSHQLQEDTVQSAWKDPLKPPPKAEAWEVMLLSQMPHEGFRLLDEQGNTRFCLITEAEWWGKKQVHTRTSKTTTKSFAATLGELQPGELAVHVDYGIGRYQGLRQLAIGGYHGEFLQLNFAESGKVYVPVSRLHLVQKYVGVEGGVPVLNKLGDGLWQRTRARAGKIVQELAAELVKLQAARQAIKGEVFAPASDLLEPLIQGFLWQETPDQQQAIEEVLEDLACERPMDRLICGEAGFGKTEVAMRAACAVTLTGGQVMLLCPTTILAQQHHANFQQRFDPLGVRVEVLSRFVPPPRQKEILQDFQKGRVDILIGTHRLLSKDAHPPSSLGLLVIDEEQRFGVTHKERIKQLRTQVNILTLSATPIPRTLHMALMGIRDLSLISTPPPERLAVRTRIARSSEHIIQETVERELRRNGQVFFVHNRVETIYNQAQQLQTLLPGIRMGIAHGRIPEAKLAALMQDFIDGKLQLLLCSSIIEAGLDIPRANTIIINQAENFGLAQLHQLRARVGRSHRQGYAWLLIHPHQTLSPQARKRLNLLQEFSAMGAGFRIAAHDLEMRGAGNLLGAEQSGHLHKVGLELFTQMVEQAAAKIKGQPTASHSRCRLQLPFPYLLPAAYITHSRQRLEIYKRLAEISQQEELWQLRTEMQDRFGAPPSEAENLFTLVKVRLCAESYGLSNLEVHHDLLQARFAQPERIDIDALMSLLTQQDSALKLQTDNLLVLGPLPSNPTALLESLNTLSQFIRPQAA